jgi:hypothetical protein
VLVCSLLASEECALPVRQHVLLRKITVQHGSWMKEAIGKGGGAREWGEQKGWEKTKREHRSNLVGGKGCREEDWKHIQYWLRQTCQSWLRQPPPPPTFRRNKRTFPLCSVSDSIPGFTRSCHTVSKSLKKNSGTFSITFFKISFI